MHLLVRQHIDPVHAPAGEKEGALKLSTRPASPSPQQDTKYFKNWLNVRQLKIAKKLKWSTNAVNRSGMCTNTLETHGAIRPLAVFEE